LGGARIRVNPRCAGAASRYTAPPLPRRFQAGFKASLRPRWPTHADMADNSYILETTDLVKEFKGFAAVSGVNLRVRRGHIHALIGPNGAGKTTVFNLLTKFLIPTRGKILYNGADITMEKPAQVARRGMVRSFQISATFPHLTVLENVRIGLQRALGTSFHFWKPARSLDVLNERAMELLRTVDLASSPTPRRWSCPTGASARSRSPPRWPPSRNCCCWTSPRRAWATRTSSA
jgi:ABC-type glutathione transport system ATPase component